MSWTISRMSGVSSQTRILGMIPVLTIHRGRLPASRFPPREEDLEVLERVQFGALPRELEQDVQQAPRDPRVTQRAVPRGEAQAEALGERVEVLALLLWEQPAGEPQRADR